MRNQPLRRQPAFLLVTPMRFGGRWAAKPDVQEAKHIKDAKKKMVTANASDQNNETTNESFMGIVANAT